MARKIFAAVLALLLCSGCSFGAQGVIGWAAGGGTDTLMRILTSQMNGQVDPVTKTGLAGAMATMYVYGQPSDGQTLLMNAENPTLYKLLGYSDVDYDDFECVLLAATEIVGVIVPADSKWKTFTEIVDAAKSGQEIVEATTNVGGMPWTLTAMLGNVTGASFIQEWYAGDMAARDAVVNGKADFTFCKLQMGREMFRDGKLKFISLIHNEKVEGWDVPLITDEYPAFAENLPWGPFYGVFVKKGTAPDVVAKWREEFLKAYNSEAFRKYLADTKMTPLGLGGEDAAKFIHDWQARTLAILSKANLNMNFRFNVGE